MSDKKGLKDAYSIKTPQDSINLYRVWSPTYDKDFAEKNDYRSPKEIASYFEKYCNEKDTPILDVGAGTGLVGQCLKEKNKSNIHAIDISPESLEIAKSKNCYTKLLEADLTEKLNIENNSYGAIVSAGTFTHGHIGPNVLDELLRITKSNGLFVITVHSKHFKNTSFNKKLSVIANTISKPNFHEVKAYGNNLDKNHSNDTVIITVFRKK